MAQAAVLALLLSAAASLSALAPTDDDASGAPPGAARQIATPAGSLDSVGQPQGTRAGKPVTGAAAPVAAAVPRPAVPTMSMDAPIQGGLTAHQAQARSAAVLASHDSVSVAAARSTWTPAMGRSAVARARSWLGMPYSWAGGGASGPTAGRCEIGNGADLDCHIVGFDCSGLMMYAWGPYAALPHFAQTQLEAGEYHPSVKQLRPGDLVFFAGYLAGGVGHVAIYEGDGKVIEAPQSGDVVRRSTLSELMDNDGAYRGAVRPLTTATPALDPIASEVPRSGGLVTVRGEHLAGVTSLTVGTRTVRTFVRRSDSALVFRAPGSSTGRAVAVIATTAWEATSHPVTFSYAKPVTTTPVAKPTSSAPKPTAPKPTPAPTSNPPSSSTAPTAAPTSGTTVIDGAATTPSG